MQDLALAYSWFVFAAFGAVVGFVLGWDLCYRKYTKALSYGERVRLEYWGASGAKKDD